MEEFNGYLLKRTQALLHAALENALKPLSITMAQYITLTALDELPNASNADLARACFVTPQTMIEILRGLEKAQLITREAHPTNKRIIRIHITAEGAAVLAAAREPVDTIEQTLQHGFDEQEQQIFRALLERCIENLEHLR